jgi:hypothetical protein
MAHGDAASVREGARSEHPPGVEKDLSGESGRIGGEGRILLPPRGQNDTVSARKRHLPIVDNLDNAGAEGGNCLGGSDRIVR